MLKDAPVGSFLIRFSEHSIDSSKGEVFAGHLTLAFVETNPTNGEMDKNIMLCDGKQWPAAVDCVLITFSFNSVLPASTSIKYFAHYEHFHSVGIQLSVYHCTYYGIEVKYQNESLLTRAHYLLSMPVHYQSHDLEV